MRLHATVGPAHTTVMDIAKSAGVERVTVYRHFPDELALFSACSAHYRAQNPLPEISAWRVIDDPVERLQWRSAPYRPLTIGPHRCCNVLRDARPCRSSGEPRRRCVADIRDLLSRGWSARGRQRQRLLALLVSTLDFHMEATGPRRESQTRRGRPDDDRPSPPPSPRIGHRGRMRTFESTSWTRAWGVTATSTWYCAKICQRAP